MSSLWKEEGDLEGFQEQRTCYADPHNLHSPYHHMEQAGPAEVIQELQHDEPAARIDAQEAADLVAQMEAGFVERNLNVAVIREPSPIPGTEQAQQDNIYLIRFSRHPQSFCDALMKGLSLRRCREALEAQGFDCVLPSGTKVFVHPQQYKSVRSALVEADIELRPYHVVLASSLEYLVEESLATIPGRDGVHAHGRLCMPKPVPDTFSSAVAVGTDVKPLNTETSAIDLSAVAKDLMPFLAVERTFIFTQRPVPNAEDVTQSTTEAHDGGVNPRRLRALTP